MLLALDFDQTYTEDPEFWDLVIAMAKHRGHQVICATMRYEHEGEEIVSALGSKVEQIIFTGRRAKSSFLHNRGYHPSVWIDDAPQWLYRDSL